ncbi:hypothetical protein LWP59_22665 [Amycolatopsis acidiphila]|nr:muconolactone Delta-isomerase family protein [Amycolatopsis acidiphila]UIJ56961.1 hypothetical protein LWP59_22665 [Amycolatopsis acidiphila]
MKTAAAVLWDHGEDWRIEELELDEPREGEVLVRLAASGLCHQSDEHVRVGDLPLGALPGIGGHAGGWPTGDPGVHAGRRQRRVRGHARPPRHPRADPVRVRDEMEFLVRQQNNTPPEEREALRPKERARAQELREAGILVKIWRVLGSTDSIALYEAADADALHEALLSLPTARWMKFQVEPLVTHPQEKKT